MRTHALSLLTGAVLAAALVAACGADGGTTTPVPAPVTTPEAAVDAVRAHSPLFDGLGPRDPELIGQGSYWEAGPATAGEPPEAWLVTFTIGWGDCQAGCIDSHHWTYEVSANGDPQLVGEDGSPLTDEVVAERLAAVVGTGAAGRVAAGPVCPVERPGDPSCKPRAVAGAQLAFTPTDGTETGAVLTTDASGWYRIALPPGDWVLTASPVEGLMGAPGPIPITVRDGTTTLVDVPYDTGIR